MGDEGDILMLLNVSIAPMSISRNRKVLEFLLASPKIQRDTIKYCVLTVYSTTLI